MTKPCLFEMAHEMKSKFKSFFVHRKKLKALENYSTVAPFKHKTYLELIKKCSQDRFLGEKEDDFLNHMLDQYEVNFLDWAHKTPWLKKKMSQMTQPPREIEKPVQKQLSFNFHIPKAKSMSVNMPFDLIASKMKSYQKERRV